MPQVFLSLHFDISLLRISITDTSSFSHGARRRKRPDRTIVNHNTISQVPGSLLRKHVDVKHTRHSKARCVMKFHSMLLYYEYPPITLLNFPTPSAFLTTSPKPACIPWHLPLQAQLLILLYAQRTLDFVDPRQLNISSFYTNTPIAHR
jgi:hypothetical protein